MKIIKQRSNDKNSKQINKFKNTLSNNYEFFFSNSDVLTSLRAPD